MIQWLIISILLHIHICANVQNDKKHIHMQCNLMLVARACVHHIAQFRTTLNPMRAHPIGWLCAGGTSIDSTTTSRHASSGSIHTAQACRRSNERTFERYAFVMILVVH
jgi:hypothetical protein